LIPAETAAPKLKWTVLAEHEKGKEQTATAGDREYAITCAGDAWQASVTVGKKTVLVESGTFGNCYTACVNDNRKTGGK
jgi:hypothetical protein